MCLADRNNEQDTVTMHIPACPTTIFVRPILQVSLSTWPDLFRTSCISIVGVTALDENPRLFHITNCSVDEDMGQSILLFIHLESTPTYPSSSLLHYFGIFLRPLLPHFLKWQCSRR